MKDITGVALLDIRGTHLQLEPELRSPGASRSTVCVVLGLYEAVAAAMRAFEGLISYALFIDLMSSASFTIRLQCMCTGIELTISYVSWTRGVSPARGYNWTLIRGYTWSACDAWRLTCTWIYLDPDIGFTRALGVFGP